MGSLLCCFWVWRHSLLSFCLATCVKEICVFGRPDKSLQEQQVCMQVSGWCKIEHCVPTRHTDYNRINTKNFSKLVPSICLQPADDSKFLRFVLERNMDGELNTHFKKVAYIILCIMCYYILGV